MTGALSPRPDARRLVAALTRGRFLAFACAIVALGLSVRIAVGALKTDFHVDEGITLALTNGSWKPPVVKPLFDRWMSKAELENLAFNSNLIASGRPDFAGIARATGADVHPPLFYWLFALARVIVGPAQHMAAILLLNGSCYLVTAVLLALMVIRANRGSLEEGKVQTLVILALFATTPVSVALTSFMRMYELSQLACAALACMATYVVFPGRDGKYGYGRPIAMAGLSIAFFAGTMTHYHFLFFALPLCLVAACLLLARAEISTLLWCVFSAGAGIFAADAVFPELRLHLLYSSRSHEGFDLASRIFSGEAGAFFSRASAFLRMMILHVPVIASAVLIWTIAAIRRLRSSGGPAASRGASPSTIPASFILLLAIPSAAASLAIALTAPFATLRYLSPMVPVVVAAFACAVLRGGRDSPVPRAGILALTAAVSLALCLLPGGVPSFHDEYPADQSPEYFRDSLPVIVVSNRQGFEWKNLLAYLVIPDNKRVFVTMRYEGGDMVRSLEEPLRLSGEKEAYVMIDVLFPPQEGMERIGYYGFFSVYRITE